MTQLAADPARLEHAATVEEHDVFDTGIEETGLDLLGGLDALLRCEPSPLRADRSDEDLPVALLVAIAREQVGGDRRQMLAGEDLGAG